MKSWGFSASSKAVLGGAVALLICVLAIAASSAPEDPRLAAAVFPPWWSNARILAAAQRAGQVMAVGASANIVVVRTVEGAAGERLRAQGALILLDPESVATCGGMAR